MTAIAVSLIVLRCLDLERSRRFYEALGLTLRPEQHGVGPRHYSAVVGETVVELYPQGDATTSGLRLGFLIQDLPAVLAAIAHGDGNVMRADVNAQPPSALVVDPDGHKIELTQRIVDALFTSVQ